MSNKVLTMAALQSRSDGELQALMRKAQHDLAHSAPGSHERRNALSSLENITRVMHQRWANPRPPGF